MPEQRRVVVSEEIWALLDQLAKSGLFGSGASGAGAHIIRNELSRLIVSGELDKLLARVSALGIAAKDRSDSD